MTPDKITLLENQLAAPLTLQAKIDTINALAWELRYDDVARAIQLSQAARELATQGEFQAQPYQKGLAESLRNLGHCYERLANYDLALSFLHEALTLFRAMANPSEEGTILYLLGGTYWSLGDYFNALDYEFKALKLCQAIDDRLGIGKALNIIGLVYQSVGDFAAALNYFLQSLQTYEEIGLKRGQGDALSNCCEVCFDLGEYDQALTYGLKSLQIHEEINYQSDLGLVLVGVGRVSLALQQHAQALDYLRRALEISRETGNRYSELRALLYLGDIYGRQHENDLALSLLHQAVGIAQELGVQQELYECYQVLARVYKQLGDFEKALTAHEQFYTLKQKVLEEIASHKFKILEIASEMEAAKREAEAQRLKNIELEQAIAKRQRAEEALLTSLHQNTQLVAAINNLSSGVVVTDPNQPHNPLVFVNPAFTDMTGYRPDEVIGKNCRFLQGPETDPLAVAEIRQALAHKKVCKVTLLNYRKDGTPFWNELTVSPVFDAQGQLINFVGLQNDVTQRKQMEETLKKSEDWLRRIFSTISDHIYVTELTHTGQSVNRFISPTEALTGYPQEKILADWDFWPSTLIHPDDRARAAAQFQCFVRGESSEVEYRLTRADGRLIWVRDSGRVERDPLSQNVIVYGVVSDITARKQAEEALAKRSAELEEALNMLNGVIENLPAMLFMKDAESLHFTHFNKAAEELVGLERAEVIGKSDYDFFPQEQADFFVAKDREVLAKGNLVDIAEESIQTVHQGVRLLYTRKAPILDAHRKPKYLLGVSVDITERKQAEEALAQARDQALEASRLKSQLLAKVSHELRTPLGAILGYTELLQYGVFGPLSDEQQKATVEIIDSTQYLTHMVNELLDQAQLETGKVSLNIRSFILADMVNQVETKMNVLAQSKGLTLTTDIAAELPSTLAGDQKRLQQILLNLISNAIKFTQTGGVQVRLYQPDLAYWAIQVADTGIGIPPEAQAYIFEPFQQVDGSITREQTGTGLGLSIVKHLVSLMGGQITLESKVGQGSIFTILLPLNPIPEKTA